jgi:hypothetical protein
MASHCAACGKRDAITIDVMRNTVHVTSGTLCRACFLAALAEARVYRAEFDALIAAGVPRGEANRRVIERIGRRPS